MCLGFFPLGYGLLFVNPWLIGLGVLWLVVGYFGWIVEPLAEGDDDDVPTMSTTAPPRAQHH
jgi:cytochrome c oxidase subunit I